MNKSLWVSFYAIAMAAVESAVVVYLRALHPAQASVSVLLHQLPPNLVTIEIGREAATLVMILAVAALAGRTLRDRFLYFALIFGIWDIFYYVWFRVFIGWPPSLFTWDVLFLIPVPWLGPVIAPIIVSLCLVAGSLWFLTHPTLQLRPLAWGLVILGAAVVLLSFTLDYRYAIARTDPPRFRWELFGSGIALAMLGLTIPFFTPRIVAPRAPLSAPPPA
ncbi:MAG TPA: hypothetical protein VG454_00485 [Gemmatimonadales bacterium]|nr:hypothetical protein [Gemmatimonadales bacterium]